MSLSDTCDAEPKSHNLSDNFDSFTYNINMQFSLKSATSLVSVCMCVCVYVCVCMRGYVM